MAPRPNGPPRHHHRGTGNPRHRPDRRHRPGRRTTAPLGHLTNTAHATGTDPQGGTVRSPDARVELPVATGAAKLSITKTADNSGPVRVGGTVTYTYTNTGGTTVGNLAVTDDHASNVTCDRTALDPGRTATCHATYVVTADDGKAGHVTNRAHATGTDPQGGQVRSPDAELRITVATCPPKGNDHEGCPGNHPSSHPATPATEAAGGRTRRRPRQAPRQAPRQRLRPAADPAAPQRR
ncbi:hypothetical protein [Kitasatospora sp. NPDC057500]|uniref:DUF7507 domain-containing protein n=1 Tax=Kitasatospora sp. NPDC057500 TaxID=3346151 RepID=UPI0036BE7DE4